MESKERLMQELKEQDEKIAKIVEEELAKHTCKLGKTDEASIKEIVLSCQKCKRCAEISKEK